VVISTAFPTQTKVSDNGISFKFLFGWRCFIIKRNICGKISKQYVCHSCCISNVWLSEEIVSPPLFD